MRADPERVAPFCESAGIGGIKAPTRRVHLDTTTRRGSAKRNAAFTLQHGAVLTTRQPEGSVPVVVSSCAPTRGDLRNWLDRFELSLLSKPLEQQHPAEEAVRTYCPP